MKATLADGHAWQAWAARLSSAHALPTPGPVHGAYPIRPSERPSTSMTWAWLSQQWQSPSSPSAADGRRLLKAVREQLGTWQALDGPAFEQALTALRAQLSIHGFERDLVAQAMGAVGAIVQRQLGWQVHDVQWLGAWWMLGGRLIEMATGEGKSLTVVLAVAVAALAHVPVHVMTANDYLARRDAEQWRPVYQALGLSVASITSGSTMPQRQQAYLQDLVYVTAREVAFDFLRDQSAKAQGQEAQMVLRGLCMAIIDEADSILIDEACTPLVLSQALPSRQAEQQQRLALFLARQMVQDQDFSWAAEQPLRLHPPGQARLDQAAHGLSGPWRLKRFREEQVVLALTALHVLARDIDYLIRDDTIHIIDATTGRLAVGRAWSRGLHQMICIKEGIEATPETETLIQTTYQEFFPRYHRVCGLSGTLWEERSELMAIHGLPVVRMPLKQPSKRLDLGLSLLPDTDAQWQAVADAAMSQAQAGRAVLVGTASVADSEGLSEVLRQRGIDHQLLNARHDDEQGDDERALIARAGQAGAITVATHMAGRGTDIHLSPEVLGCGGLHVINTHLNSSARIDRQLYGRAARQGQPGSFECILRQSDVTLALLARQAWWRTLVARSAQGDWSQGVIRRLCAWAQWREGRRACTLRWNMLQTQQAMRRQLLWAGRDEWI